MEPAERPEVEDGLRQPADGGTVDEFAATGGDLADPLQAGDDLASAFDEALAGGPDADIAAEFVDSVTVPDPGDDPAELWT